MAVRCWTLHTPQAARDVVVQAAEDATLAALTPLLARHGPVGAGVWSGSRRLADDTPLTDAALRHGAALGLGRPGPRDQGVGGALELQVTGGPDAGRVLPLGQGTVTVGRGSSCTIPLADPDVSRQHVRVTVAGTGVTACDLGSVNGSRWDRGSADLTDLTGAPVGWPLGGRLRVGASCLRLAAAAGNPVGLTPVTGGRLAVATTGRRTAPVATSVSVQVPGAPGPAPRRALAWVAILVPAVGGVAMAWLLSAPQFLFFACLSPVVAAATWVSDRWSGRRGHRRLVAEHAAALAEADTRTGDALATEVAGREQAFPDLATLASAARRGCEPLWGRGATDPELLVLRLGTGPGTTLVSRVGDSGTAVGETAPYLPVTADLRDGGLDLLGPRSTVLSVARSLICQVATLHPPSAVHLILLAAPGGLPDWRWARWLPHLSPSARGGTGERLVVVDASGDRTLLAQARALRAAGTPCLVLTGGGSELDANGAGSVTVVGETGSTARFSRAGHVDRDLVVDGVSEEVAAELAGRLAPLVPAADSGGIPGTVRWRDLVPRGGWTTSRAALRVTLGAGERGPVTLDLCTAGPHALVAGTTGAGKSELLRTLVLALADGHPPDRCSLLLVDYKGGSAFAEAAHLPHTVGLLTDLDGASTARALRSLSAELTRREALMAAHRVRELAELPEEVVLPRLVIVVDEFATLADELPGFVPGLVGIAQRGRSLGVHLVLATQRPAGVVSPEIRANCTLRVCLRTTDEAGSRDILGVPDASWLPVDRPGRALLRVGAQPPVPFQVARVTGPRRGRAGTAVTAWCWPDPPELPAPAPGSEQPPPVPGGLAEEVAALTRRAASAGLPAPPRPWLPPLPDEIHPLDPAAGSPPHLLRWGVCDRPDRQAQEPLWLDLAAGGSWLLPGGPGSGRTTALRSVLGEAVHQLPPDGLHVHVIDHGGGRLADVVTGLAHLGTAVRRDDGYRLVRLLSRLLETVDARRAVPDLPRPHLLVLLDGADSVLTLLEELLPGTGSGALLRLLRDGAAVGLTCLLTADRMLPGGRLSAAVTHRLVLPFTDRADYAVAGIPATAVPAHRPPGRALLDGDAVEVQIALPRSLTDPAPPGTIPSGPTETRRTATGTGTTVTRTAPTGTDPRDRIIVAELAPDPVTPGPPPPSDRTLVTLGPGGDAGNPLWIDLTRTDALLVCGPSGSGRTTALAALAVRAAATGLQVAAVLARRDDSWASAGGPRACSPDLLPGWVTALAGRPAVLAVDDLALLPDAAMDQVSAACRPGAGVLLMASASAADVAGAFRGPAVTLRRAGTVLLLQPGRGDAELLSLRLPRAELPRRPGSGWLVEQGLPRRVQVARERPRRCPADQGPAQCS